MAEQSNRVLPTEIDMSWAAVNPTADDPIGEHLQDYTDRRTEWAEAIHESWVKQIAAAEIHDEAQLVVELPVKYVDALRFDPYTSVNIPNTSGNISGYFEMPKAVPAVLGSTSLRFIREKATTPNADPGVADIRTTRDGLQYSYGFGAQAQRAKQLEVAVNEAAQRAAGSIAEDSSLDSVSSVMWRGLLNAKKQGAQLQPEIFAIEGLRLISQVRDKLAHSDWLADVEPTALTVVKLASDVPLVSDGQRVVVNGSDAIRVETNEAYHYTNDSPRFYYRDSELSYRSYAPFYGSKKAQPVMLLDASQIKETPSASFERLRAVLSQTRQGDYRVVLPDGVISLLDDVGNKSNRGGRFSWIENTPRELKLSLAKLGLSNVYLAKTDTDTSEILSAKEAESRHTKQVELIQWSRSQAAIRSRRRRRNNHLGR